jgi:hypothetical protein
MLNVTEMFLEKFIEKIEQINVSDIPAKGQVEIFKFLDDKLYSDNNDTNEKILEYSEKYFKYDFLTNGGESFDFFKSFAYSDKNTIGFVFEDNDGAFFSGICQKPAVIKVVQDFLNWLKNEGAANK